MRIWYLAGAIGVCTLGGGGLAWRWKDSRGLVLGFCAGALTAGAVGDVPELWALLEMSGDTWPLLYLLSIYMLGFVSGALLEWRVPFAPVEAGLSGCVLRTAPERLGDACHWHAQRA